MRKLSLALGLGLVLVAGPALAQVNIVPQIGVSTSTIRAKTYSAVSIGLVPAASATDIFCISGSSSKGIAVRRIQITGTAGTLVNTPIVLLHRATLDTGGTAATTTAAPNLTLGPHNSTNPAATATLIAYTANPTINDTSPTYARSAVLALQLAGTTLASNPGIDWKFGSDADFYDQGLDIPSGATTQQWCLNLNAASVSSGLLQISIEWVEG